ncbi:hypothetical protein ASG52_17670 [Methylobacterium sp. Leaf456]|nr:hypothetical protein ASG52_17670 [Methylobacterium sp. Leaf456]
MSFEHRPEIRNLSLAILLGRTAYSSLHLGGIVSRLILRCCCSAMIGELEDFKRFSANGIGILRVI